MPFHIEMMVALNDQLMLLVGFLWWANRIRLSEVK